MSIEVEVRTVYDNELIYPVDNNARVFCFLMQKKTLSRSDLEKIKSLDIDIKLKQETYDWQTA